VFPNITDAWAIPCDEFLARSVTATELEEERAALVACALRKR